MPENSRCVCHPVSFEIEHSTMKEREPWSKRRSKALCDCAWFFCLPIFGISLPWVNLKWSSCLSSTFLRSTYPSGLSHSGLTYSWVIPCSSRPLSVSHLRPLGFHFLPTALVLSCELHTLTHTNHCSSLTTQNLNPKPNPNFWCSQSHTDIYSLGTLILGVPSLHSL
jgi:hypothetical protein